jgi:hypothetical protein
MKQPRLYYNDTLTSLVHRWIHPNSTPSFKNSDGRISTLNIEHNHWQCDTNNERWRQQHGDMARALNLFQLGERPQVPYSGHHQPFTVILEAWHDNTVGTGGGVHLEPDAAVVAGVVGEGKPKLGLVAADRRNGVGRTLDEAALDPRPRLGVGLARRVADRLLEPAVLALLPVPPHPLQPLRRRPGGARDDDGVCGRPRGHTGREPKRRGGAVVMVVDGRRAVRQTRDTAGCEVDI